MCNIASDFRHIRRHQQTKSEKGMKVRISDESVNCYGTRILTSGIDLTQYKRNPVLLYMHERGKVVGIVTDLQVEGGELFGTLEFDKASSLSEQLSKQYAFGSMKMVSANFRILETSSSSDLIVEGQLRETVTRCQLFEVSCVDIGGNDNALVLSDDQGNDISMSGASSMLLPLLNDNKHHNNPLKFTRMDIKTLALQLGLPETSTEDAVEARLSELLLSASRVSQLEEQVRTLESRESQLLLSSVAHAVDGAIQEKRIPSDMRNHFIELGKKLGLESLELTLSAIPAQVKLSTVLHRRGGTIVSDAPDFGKYEKLSAVPADEMMDLHDNHHAEFVRLYKAEYGFEPEV